MTTERRTFRPFDVAADVAEFLDDARLRIGDDTEGVIDRGSRRVLDVSDLRSGDFSLEITPTDGTFGEVLEAAEQAASVYGGNVELAIVVSSGYLKTTDVVGRLPISEVSRVVKLTNGSPARSFGAVHHGCDVDAFLCLTEELERQPLAPWRKGTWLSRARFELRTGLEGVGFTLLPLTDERREAFVLPAKSLRYAALDESPLDATSATSVTFYVDRDLLARLNKSPRKDWAKAFTDQLVVDILSAVALRALADDRIHDRSWSDVRDHLLGSLIRMVGGFASDDEGRGQALLELLRNDPLRFVALIEDVCEMRDAGKLIVGGG